MSAAGALVSESELTLEELRLRSQYLLVRVNVRETLGSEGIIMLPDEAKKKPQDGEVVKRGGRSYDSSGNDLDLLEGDRVLFSMHGGRKMVVGDTEYLVLVLDQVYARVSEGEFIAPDGRLIVETDPEPKKHGEILLPTRMTDDKRRRGEKGERLVRGRVVASGRDDIDAGQVVWVKPFEGLRIEHGDPSIPLSDLIPPGREYRFYKTEIEETVFLEETA